MRIVAGMFVALVLLDCDRGGRSSSASVDASQPDVAAFHIGLTGKNGTLILAEGVFAEHATVSIGSDATATMSIPAEYGIASRTIVRDGALVFTPQDVFAKYEDGEARVEPEAKSPWPIRGGRYVLHLGDVHVLVDSLRVPVE